MRFDEPSRTSCGKVTADVCEEVAERHFHRLTTRTLTFFLSLLLFFTFVYSYLPRLFDLHEDGCIDV